MMDEPLVTIGMPVRNGGEQIRTAIDSLLSQTHRNLRLIISDNCSTDDTFEICSAYAQADSRVTVIRQPVNLGICGNFRFVLMKAETPYFMWACHDDVWAPDFIRKNLENLRAHPTAVASTSRVIMATVDGRKEMSNGTFALRGDRRQRRHLEDRAAFRAGDRISVQIVEFRAAALALALDAEFRSRHGRSPLVVGKSGSLARWIKPVKPGAMPHHMALAERLC